MNCEHYVKQCPLCDSAKARHERTLNGIELLRCGICDFVYANLSDEDIKAANSSYDQQVAARYRQQQTFINVVWFQKIVKKLTSMAGQGKVLDVGCGNGLLLKSFMEGGWEAYGVDLSSWAQEAAERYGYKLYSSLEQADLPENYFDAVTCTSTLEHLPQPRQDINKIIKVLKSGGIAYFCGTPNYSALSIRLNIAGFHSNFPPEHTNYFTPGSIRRLFYDTELAESIGRLSVKTYGVPELHRVYALLRKSTRRMVQSGTGEIKEDAAHSQAGLKSLALKVLAAIIITVNYNLGRPFSFGDKLEIIAVKR